MVLTLGLSEDATLCHNPRPVATERTRESKGARAILMIATLYSPVTNSHHEAVARNATICV